MGQGGRRETWDRETGEKHGAERRGRNMGQRDVGETWGRETGEKHGVERHQRTPHPHPLAPPHNLNLSTTILSQNLFSLKETEFAAKSNTPSRD